ncbi:MAG: 30S ribosomal protein S17 [Deltaproteobacteria bacterium]|nr:30S ribosomal protein S17 [Deltaproteobacteria bacterium]MBN2673236.1 30S ribosomal protein S17 [Deltaproteobacteria bacterium]
MADARKRVMTGQVYKAGMDKTIVVEVSRRVQDPKYKKVIIRRSRFKAHDENNECKAGDIVKIKEHRPISKEKNWMLVEIVRKAVEV